MSPRRADKAKVRARPSRTVWPWVFGVLLVLVLLVLLALAVGWIDAGALRDL